MRLAHKIALLYGRAVPLAQSDAMRPDMFSEQEIGDWCMRDIAIAKSSPSIICDNIADYYCSEITARRRPELPPCPPAWRSACFEIPNLASNGRCCVVYEALEGQLMKETIDRLISRPVKSYRGTVPSWSIDTGFQDERLPPVPSTAKWLIRHSLWFELVDGRVACVVAGIFTVLDETCRQLWRCMIPYQAAQEGLLYYIYADLVAMSLAFASCRNVEHRDVTETEGPSAKWLRRMKAPTLRYYTLEIDPMRKVLSSEGNVEQNGIGKALHLCRGHFKTYTADAPLFGRTVGTVWCPQHARGKIENGAVIKDYSVKAPG